jgi:hypothetical protein
MTTSHFSQINELAVLRVGEDADVLTVLESRIKVLKELVQYEPANEDYHNIIRTTQDAISIVRLMNETKDRVSTKNRKNT